MTEKKQYSQISYNQEKILHTQYIQYVNHNQFT